MTTAITNIGPTAADPPPLYLDPKTIDQHFPFDTYREGQRDAIEFAVNAFNSGKDIVIIEAPTGAGKSGIGCTIMDMVNTSYYLTVTKLLQDQLVTEFGDELVELKGRASYPCTWWDRYGQKLVDKKVMAPARLKAILASDPNCGEGFCRTDCPASEQITAHKCKRCFPVSGDPSDKKGGSLKVLPDGMNYSACPYYEQVYKAIAGRKIVMNFSSFLFQTGMTNRFDVPRDLMVVDECHQTESVLLDFISLTIDDRLLRKGGLELPHFETALEYAIWFADNKLDVVLTELFKESKNWVDQADDTKGRQDALRQQDDLGRLIRKYKEFMDHMTGERESEWVCEVEDVKSGQNGWRKLTLKPVLVHNFVHDLLFRRARKILMMSATVLDVSIMCNALGIDRSRVASFRMKNRFPAKLRPIYLETCGKISGGKTKMHEWGPAMVRKVDEIIQRYPDQRGIIHTHNFAIAEMLLDGCTNEVRNRFTFQKRYRDKIEMLQHHADRPDSIIVAPAMHEGLNLVEDLSRVQIICKVPYPNFHEDKQLKRRMEIDSRHLDWLTALKLVQSYGRSIRSNEDWADTYIIDETIKFFIHKAGKMLPSWFLEAIKER